MMCSLTVGYYRKAMKRAASTLAGILRKLTSEQFELSELVIEELAKNAVAPLERLFEPPFTDM